VDNDDGSYNFHTHHNFLVYGSYGLKSDYGGHDNHHDHNIYAYLGIEAMFLDRMLPGHEDRFSWNMVIFASNGGFQNASVVGPGKNLLGVPCSAPTYIDGSWQVGDETVVHGNKLFTMDGRMSVCGNPVHEFGDNTSAVELIPDDNVILGWASDLLGMAEMRRAAAARRGRIGSGGREWQWRQGVAVTAGSAVLALMLAGALAAFCCRRPGYTTPRSSITAIATVEFDFEQLHPAQREPTDGLLAEAFRDENQREPTDRVRELTDRVVSEAFRDESVYSSSNRGPGFITSPSAARLEGFYSRRALL
jgi:hypothetical protein